MADLQTVRVFGFAGSLRKSSYNRMALRAAGDLLPPGMTLETFDLAPIPPYNEDVRALGFPAPVQEFRDRIAAADALLIVTPEYNYSMPGVLKNAIDWASRPPSQPFDGKPVGHHGGKPGHAGHSAGPVSSAPELRVSQHAFAQPAGGDDRPLPGAVRRRRTPRRREDPPNRGPAFGRPRRLDETSQDRGSELRRCGRVARCPLDSPASLREMESRSGRGNDRFQSN